MVEKTKIEWADHTFNPWIGCTEIGPGCDNCYARTLMQDRLKFVQWGAGQKRKLTTERNWNEPRRWQANAKIFMTENHRRQRVFCASLSDVFDGEVPESWRARLLTLIRETPDLDWLLLTKRVGNVRRMVQSAAALAELLTTDGYFTWPKNIWVGATVCNQEEVERDLPRLLEIGARYRFLSIEPMLGPVTLGPSVRGPHSLDWVICGGESGATNRRMEHPWAVRLRDECAALGIPFLFKQWGAFNESGEPGLKLSNGRELDGVTWDQWPDQQ